jgi:hypothetical protein
MAINLSVILSSYAKLWVIFIFFLDRVTLPCAVQLLIYVPPNGGKQINYLCILEFFFSEIEEGMFFVAHLKNVCRPHAAKSKITDALVLCCT